MFALAHRDTALKDKFGLSWQVVPVQMEAMMSDPDKAKVSRVMRAKFGMKKLDIAALELAFEGKPVPP